MQSKFVLLLEFEIFFLCYYYFDIIIFQQSFVIFKIIKKMIKRLRKFHTKSCIPYLESIETVAKEHVHLVNTIPIIPEN